MFLQHQIDTTIMRLHEFEPLEGYYLAFSGGKDSIVIKQLAIESGVTFDAHYNCTTIDPPELCRFIRTYHKDIKWEMPDVSFLKMMSKRGFPTRLSRWCCDEYKERGGANRVVMTGVRWAESAKRSKRRMVEQCYRKKNRTFLHLIIDWSDEDVWAFIRDRKLPYCELYNYGFKRIGCVFCPMSYYKNRLKEVERYPKITRNFIKAFEILYQDRLINNPETVSRWTSGEDIFNWWVGEGDLPTKEIDENQVMLFE